MSNYYLLDDYRYPEKNLAISIIDQISAPFRIILGGRDVNLMTMEYGDVPSVITRITVLFLMIIVLPVGVLAMTGLLAKLLSFSFTWERQIFEKEKQTTLKIIEIFELHKQNNEPIEVFFKSLNSRPQLFTKIEIMEFLQDLVLQNKETLNEQKILQVIDETFRPLVKELYIDKAKNS